jgi:hypothetical protein
MTSGRQGLTALVISVFLAACASSGGSLSRPASTSTGPAPADPSGIVAVQPRSVVELDAGGAATKTLAETSDINGVVQAVARLSDGTLVYTDCCERDGAIVNLRAFNDPEFHMTGSALGASHDGTKLATLDNTTGELQIYDVESHATRRLKTEFTADAPWETTGGQETIAWSDDDTTLTMLATNGRGLVVLDARTGATVRTVKAPGTLRWPMTLSGQRVGAVAGVATGPSKLLAIDARTGTSTELGTLQIDPGSAAARQPARFATATRDGNAVIFIGGDGKLYRFDVNTHASTPLGDQSNYSWVDA